MRKALARHFAPLLFVAAISGWAAREFASTLDAASLAAASVVTAPTARIRVEVPVLDEYPTAVATETPWEPSPEPTPETLVSEAPQPTPGAVAAQVPAGRPVLIPPTTTATPRPVVERVSAEEETRRYAALQTLARAASASILARDAGALRAQLSENCLGMDVPGFIAGRRSIVEHEAGRPLTELKAAQPVITHLDTQVGDAHVIFQYDGPPRVSILIAEGYVWEGGGWRYLPCA